MNKLCFIFLLFIGYTAICQEKESNIIISVDGSANPNISRIKIEAEYTNGEKKVYNVNYFPGKFSIQLTDYQELESTPLNFLSLNFDYNEFCNEKHIIYNYEIDLFKLNWLDHNYIVLNVYNTNKKEYKKIYNPLPGKEYTYEYEYPGGGMKRAKKRLPKCK